MNMPENSLDYYQLANRKVLGSRTWEGKQDMINIVLIGLAKDLPVHDEKYELHRLLVALMSKQLTTSEKLNIIEKEYKIQVNDPLRKDVSVMCNLSQGIVDETLEKVVLNMNRLGYTSEQIAKAVEMSKEAVERIIEVNKFILA